MGWVDAVVLPVPSPPSLYPRLPSLSVYLSVSLSPLSPSLNPIYSLACPIAAMHAVLEWKGPCSVGVKQAGWCKDKTDGSVREVGATFLFHVTQSQSWRWDKTSQVYADVLRGDIQSRQHIPFLLVHFSC
jgi:hypothetical protein